MKIENLEFMDPNNLCYHDIENDVEFCMFFNWEFNSYNANLNTATLHVTPYDCEQWINGVKSAYIPTVQEMIEVTQAIENVVFQDLNGYGLGEWLDSRDQINFNEY
jgi:hypothetical protein